MKQRHKSSPSEKPEKTSGERRRLSQPVQQTEPIDNLGVERGQNAEKGNTVRPENINAAKRREKDEAHH